MWGLLAVVWRAVFIRFVNMELDIIWETTASPRMSERKVPIGSLLRLVAVAPLASAALAK